MLKHVSFAHMMSPNAHFSWPNQSVFLRVFLRKEQVKKKEIYESCMLMPISWKIKFNITQRFLWQKIQRVLYFSFFSFIKKHNSLNGLKIQAFFASEWPRMFKSTMLSIQNKKVSLLWLLKLIITRKKSYLNICPCFCLIFYCSRFHKISERRIIIRNTQF